MRVGLMPTLRMSTGSCAARHAATTKNAAEEKSAGTRTGAAVQALAALEGNRGPALLAPGRRKLRSMRSV